VDDLIAAARAAAGKPRPCAICGTPTPAADLLEAFIPSLTVEGDEYFRCSFTLTSGAWVCPNCSAFANQGEAMPPA
jgi:hypothetical protein